MDTGPGEARESLKEKLGSVARGEIVVFLHLCNTVYHTFLKIQPTHTNKMQEFYHVLDEW
ncbi:hypothetical protein A7D21_17760 [Pseudomonas sp. AP19]|nr:hypothetical protein A7D21_17760 [Pseudomonas sp. AP19]